MYTIYIYTHKVTESAASISYIYMYTCMYSVCILYIYIYTYTKGEGGESAASVLGGRDRFTKKSKPRPEACAAAILGCPLLSRAHRAHTRSLSSVSCSLSLSVVLSF